VESLRVASWFDPRCDGAGSCLDFFNEERRLTLMERYSMNINISLIPIVSLIAGILILFIPRLLNFIVAIYLIVIGLIGLFGTGHFIH
jgi:hypothetical protein